VTIGVGFGTPSARAVVVRVADGELLGSGGQRKPPRCDRGRAATVDGARSSACDEPAVRRSAWHRARQPPQARQQPTHPRVPTWGQAEHLTGLIGPDQETSEPREGVEPSTYALRVAVSASPGVVGCRRLSLEQGSSRRLSLSVAGCRRFSWVFLWVELTTRRRPGSLDPGRRFASCALGRRPAGRWAVR